MYETSVFPMYAAYELAECGVRRSQFWQFELLFLVFMAEKNPDFVTGMAPNGYLASHVLYILLRIWYKLASFIIRIAVQVQLDSYFWIV